MLRQSVFGRLAGYEDVNDAERLRHDPAMRELHKPKSTAMGAEASRVDPEAGPVILTHMRGRLRAA
jgi:hypothetical protein